MPGIAPLTAIIDLSLSISIISKFFTVTASTPICPAIFLPLKVESEENNKKETDTKKQITAIFYDISNTGITETTTWKGYNILLKDGYIPILKLSNKGRDYKKYFNQEYIENSKKSIAIK